MSSGKHIGKPIYTIALGLPCPICSRDRRISVYKREGRKRFDRHINETCGRFRCRKVLANQRRKETMLFLAEAS